MALNFQTAGEGMDLNDGLFRQNAGCGYILKPDFMRHPESRFNPEAPQNRDTYRPLVFHVQVSRAGTQPSSPRRDIPALSLS